MAQVMGVEAGNFVLAFETLMFDTSSITDDQHKFFLAYLELGPECSQWRMCNRTS